MTDRHPWIPDQLPTKYRAAQLGTPLYPTRLRASQKTTDVEKTYKRIKFLANLKFVVPFLYLLVGCGFIAVGFKSWVFALAILIVCGVPTLAISLYDRADIGFPISSRMAGDEPPVAVETQPATIGQHERFAALYSTVVSTPGAMTDLAQDWAEMCDLADEATGAVNSGTEDPTVLSAYDMALQRYADHITARLRSISRANNAPKYPTDDAAERAQAILNRVPTDQPGDLS